MLTCVEGGGGVRDDRREHGRLHLLHWKWSEGGQGAACNVRLLLCGDRGHVGSELQVNCVKSRPGKVERFPRFYVLDLVQDAQTNLG